jgi:hypothetical protein
LAHGTAAGGTWGKAEEVPGIATLNKGNDAMINSVSCGSAGNCSAVGFYSGSSGNHFGFVVSQVNGIWGKAKEVPGTGGGAEINSVSCASAGNCSAGGYFTSSSSKQQGFVVSQVSGTWGKAEEVPGTATLNTGGFAETDSVSCTSAGNCSAGGFYSDSSGAQAFVVSQVNGTWGKAEEVPGTAILNKGNDAMINSVSCASEGNCSAGGSYAGTEIAGDQAFVVSQVNGTWGKAEEVPGTATLNKNGDGGIDSVSCASAGNCSAGGFYAGTGRQDFHAFVVSQVSGTWRKAEEVPGTSKNAWTNSVSCGSAGNCSAGGFYSVSSSQEAFVVSQVKGTWGKAEEVPGTATLNTGGVAETDSVSCASAGNCSAGGSYFDKSSGAQAFVVSQVSGTWSKAEEVPGTATLNTGAFAAISSVSCASAGNCSAGGYYQAGTGGTQLDSQVFVVSQTSHQAAPAGERAR